MSLEAAIKEIEETLERIRQRGRSVAVVTKQGGRTSIKIVWRPRGGV